MPNPVPRITTFCKVCGTPREWRQREIDAGRGVYCSEKCRRDDAINRVKKGDEHYRFKGGKQEVTCGNCGKPLIRKYYESKKFGYFYCDKKCAAEYYSKNFSGENASSYKTGICCDGYHYSFKRPENRNKVRKLFHNTCIMCGKQHEPGSENLIVHHIYPEQKSWAFEDAKYVCVCRHCHSILHNRSSVWDYWTPYFIELIETYMGGICWVE